MMRVILLFVISMYCLHGFAQIHTNADEAFQISLQTKKPVLLICTGSDWCANCIRLEKKILLESSFIAFADENLVILKADFPQRKTLSLELQQQNDKLAAQYNPNGVFPSFTLLDGYGTVLSSLNYINQTPAEFIAELKHKLKL